MAGLPSIVLLLLSALCATTVRGLSLTPAGCRDVNQHGQVMLRAIGEVWNTPGCGRGECRASLVEGDGTIVVTPCDPQPFPDCVVVEEDSSADFPDCCPKYRCPGRCFSEHLRQWFEVGQEWTLEGCQRATCGGTDSVGILPCGLIGLRPGCRAVPGDPDAEYPGCCHRAECDQPGEERPCYDAELDRHFAVGESWTLRGCGGQATCDPGGRATAVGCPLLVYNTHGCGLDESDLWQEYPKCCPKVTCKGCHSQRLDRFFGPGDTWTGDSCTLDECTAEPFGAAVLHQLCRPVDQPPYPDCQLFDEDLERGDYPRCCPSLRCPGRCHDDGRWFSVGEQWNSDDCTRSVCIGTNRVERMSCPFLRVDPTRRDCLVVEGDVNATFPTCCPTVTCDTPPNECHDAEGGSRQIGATWTEPGCVRSQCRAADGGVAVTSRSECPPPPSADCRLVEERPNHPDYPFCCPTYRCPGLCYSPVKDVWFSVGESWSESCVSATCVSTGQVRQAPCPFVSARRSGCKVVPGDLAADYPHCCHRVECQPNPYG